MRDDALFAAIGDPTRRDIIDLLAKRGPLTATAMDGHFSVTRQAVVKHLRVLEAAGIATAERRGNEVFYALEPTSLAKATAWLERVGSTWDRRLAALDKHLSRQTKEKGTTR
jgi:DNA-binding transcriptional ArsR family regulator